MSREASVQQVALVCLEFRVVIRYSTFWRMAMCSVHSGSKIPAGCKGSPKMLARCRVLNSLRLFRGRTAKGDLVVSLFEAQGFRMSRQ